MNLTQEEMLVLRILQKQNTTEEQTSYTFLNEEIKKEVLKHLEILGFIDTTNGKLMEDNIYHLGSLKITQSGIDFYETKA